MDKVNVKGMTLGELEEFAISLGEKRFRGKQLFDWLYTREADRFDDMTTLSKALRERLADVALVDRIHTVNHQSSTLDGSVKYLFELSDGHQIESVLIPPRTAFADPEAVREEEQSRLTLCLSTQVGCPLDCAFCATGTMGFLRNLTPGEIVDQVVQVKRLSGKNITNLVYMGMGEPLLNYDNVMKSIEIITTGMGIAARRITVSTAGISPAIRRMADEGRKVKLAISLHSLDEGWRSKLMPISRKYGCDELIDAALYYYRNTRRRVTFEYIMFDGINDTPRDAGMLIALAKRVPSKINIIPFHTIAFTGPVGIASELRATGAERMEEFAQLLRRSHVTVFIRSSAGEDIEGACGQLAVSQGRRRRVAHGHRTSSRIGTPIS